MRQANHFKRNNENERKTYHLQRRSPVRRTLVLFFTSLGHLRKYFPVSSSCRAATEEVINPFTERKMLLAIIAPISSNQVEPFLIIT